ncbi:MAG TPA: mycofactocin biosynthesis peptidyl-dipeptidase MftE [Mycobacterium sp.]|uniref:mycofactocin biosynthesis peptidyl-dipeptidase MftE n=1 Tax=Mycolicibacterium sp. TaxID=2320850 RepID=UPI0025D2F383|nr:mycofactocin biosynthesis peptidyl-dipeptidase MftE [Mycolicibacterium sp.]HPX38426.1 mycofactocin biosynthesis peptidyl-dipeptidase MftE [Mycobacterium sp.]HQC78561.1 mycofactocin biosynthesis peptidyl-dipeptidase MftE [Mycobacterium sp.]
MGEPQQLGSLTWRQLNRIGPTLLVPLGSIEQHGPHLPLDTDIRIATAVAAAAADSLGALLAPPLPYGASGEHQGFAGTISIGTEALTVVLVEYGRSACEWAQRLVFVNGHGGNLDALRAAVGLLRTEGRDVAWWSCSIDGADAHAGHTETSVLLHLCPDDVATGEIGPGNTEPLEEILGRLRDGGVSAVSASGVLGDPTTATADAGAQIFDDMVARCIARIGRWQPGSGGALT